MKRQSTILVIAILIAFSTLSSANQHTEHIDSLIKKYHEYGKFEGAVLVAEHGKIIYAKAFGLADRDNNIKNTNNTAFRIASMSKAFTSALALTFVDDGDLGLQTPISKYLPDFPTDKADKITIHHLMSNTSGLVDYTNLPGFYPARITEHFSINDLVGLFADEDLIFEPGSRFAYSNSGFVLLAQIMEKVSGKSYAQLLKERIFDPAGMNHSGYEDHGTAGAKHAKGYNKNFHGFVAAPEMDMTSMSAAAGLYSTTGDLYKWDRALTDDTILSDKSRKQMFTSYKFGYGYGWVVTKALVGAYRDTLNVLSHNGGVEGFTSRIVRIPQNDNLIVILRNVSENGVTEIGDKIMAILYDQPYQIPRKSVAEEIARKMVDESIEKGLARYRELAMQKSAIWSFAEGDFNRVGYQLINMKYYEEAIEILKLNVKAYPKSANTYDSLGEAYLLAGYDELAAMYYNLALQKIPADANLNPVAKSNLKKNALAKLEQINEN